MRQVRTTAAKTHIQELLTDSEVALSQLEIQELSEGVCDRVTIYRVLSRMVEEGLAHKTVTMDGTVKYAACHSCDSESHEHKHNHVHFSCEVCNEVTCLENVIPDFKVPRKFKVHEMNFTLSGVCPQCA